MLNLNSIGKLSIILFITLATFLPTPAFAQDALESLFGDWGGLKSGLEAHGVTSEAIVTTDLMGNVSGGIQRTAGVLSKYNLTFSVDTGKAGAWNGGTFFVYLLGSANRHTSEFVGEAQVVDNIDAYNTAKLYEMFYSHSFLDDKFSFLVGLHDYSE